MRAGQPGTREYDALATRLQEQNTCAMSMLLHNLKIDTSNFYCGGKDQKRMQARSFNP